MATISPTSSAPSTAQSGLAQFRLQQATRDADQAEQVARSLQAAAQSARLNASEAQQVAREVSTQADVAQADAGKAQQGLTLIRSAVQSTAQLPGADSRASERTNNQVPAPPVQPPALPVINALGQKTGTVINTTA